MADALTSLKQYIQGSIYQLQARTLGSLDLQPTIGAHWLLRNTQQKKVCLENARSKYVIVNIAFILNQPIVYFHAKWLTQNTQKEKHTCNVNNILPSKYFKNVYWKFQISPVATRTLMLSISHLRCYVTGNLQERTCYIPIVVIFLYVET